MGIWTYCFNPLEGNILIIIKGGLLMVRSFDSLQWFTVNEKELFWYTVNLQSRYEGQISEQLGEIASDYRKRTDGSARLCWSLPGAARLTIYQTLDGRIVW
jgi:hypothetical protein